MQTKKINCPLCHQDKTIPFIKTRGYNYTECSNCGLYYVNPQPTAESIRNFYENKNTTWNPGKETEKLNQKLVSLIKKKKPDGGVLIDFGCSEGNLLLQARKNGFNPVGLEINKTAVEYVRKNFDLNIIHGFSPDDCLSKAPKSYHQATWIGHMHWEHHQKLHQHSS